MRYQWITKVNVKHADLERTLKEFDRVSYEVFALQGAGFSPAGEPLVTLVARKRNRGRKASPPPSRKTRAIGVR